MRKIKNWLKSVLIVVFIILFMGALIFVGFIETAKVGARGVCEYLGYDGANIAYSGKSIFEYKTVCLKEIPLEQIE